MACCRKLGFTWLKRLLCFCVVLISACATAPDVPESAHILVSVRPVHSMTTGVEADTALTSVGLLDNDGNMYVSRWAVDEAQSEVFLASVATCREKVKPAALWEGQAWQHVSEVDGAELIPSLYKAFNLCIANADGGYVLKRSSGYSPNSYELSVYRGHSEDSHYMPVGGMYSLAKRGSRLSGVFSSVKSCHGQALAQQGVDEQHFDGYTYVSIASYIDVLHGCLSDHGLQVTGRREK